MTRQSITFEASFPGHVYALKVPMQSVMAIYAQESEEGVYFDEADNDGMAMSDYEEVEEELLIPPVLGDDSDVAQKPVFKVVDEED